jgi:glutamine synthetase
MNAPFDQLSTWLKEHKITEVECVISDLTGIARGKIAPTNKFLHERGMRLPESVLLQTVTGDFVDDDIYYDLLDPADIDMVCRPVADAVYVVPWAIEPTAIVIHDTFDKFGNPIELSPRNVLKKVLQLYTDKGWQPIVAPEMEFYLTQRCEDPDLPLKAPMGRSGRAESGRQSFSIDAANEFDPLFEDVYDWCEAAGPGPRYADPRRRPGADGNQLPSRRRPGPGRPDHRVQTHPARSRAQAQRGRDLHGQADGRRAGQCHAPAPERGGNRHRQADLRRCRRQDERAVPASHRRPAEVHPQVLPMFAPNVNSFRRFLPDTSAPVNVEWGEENRTVGLRVPTSSPEAMRVENRLPGADANPYLAIAASLLCGYLGMVEGSNRAPVEGRAYERRNLRLPITIEDALTHMEECETVSSTWATSSCAATSRSNAPSMRTSSG